MERIECMHQALREAASMERTSELITLLSHLNVLHRDVSTACRGSTGLGGLVARGERQPLCIASFNCRLLSTLTGIIATSMSKGRDEMVSTLFNWLKERNRDRTSRVSQHTLPLPDARYGG
jgi:hypothetical protein